MMKKFLATLLAFALVVSFFPTGVATAQDPAKPTITIGEASINVQEDSYVYVPVTITNNPGIAGISWVISTPAGMAIDAFEHLDFDEENGSIFTIVNRKGKLEVSDDVSESHNPAEGLFNLGTANVREDDGVLFWIVYEVSEDAVDGSYEISITKSNKICDENTAVDITSQFDFVSGSVTVSGGVSEDMVVPTVDVTTNIEEFAYGETMPTLTASVTTPSYSDALTGQWYCGETKLDGETAATLAVEAGFLTAGFGDYTFKYVATNSYQGVTKTAEDSVTVTYKQAEITEIVAAIAAPEKGAAPQTAIAAGSNYSFGEISWSPAVEGNKFAASTAYTATVTATVTDSNYKFASSVVAVGLGTFAPVDGTLTITKTFPATAEKALTGIEITTNPSKTEYIDGEEFSTAGMVVTASYDDGSTAPVTDYTVSPEVMTMGVTEVTVSYGGYSDTVAVTVEANTLKSIAITTLPTKTVYTVGDVADWTGMVVTATYKRNNTRELAVGEYTVTGFDSSVYAAEQTITVTHEGKTATFTIVINRKPAGEVTVVLPENAVYSGTAYEATVTPAAGMGAVTVLYNGKAELPKNAGTYAVTYSVAQTNTHEGLTNVEAGSFTIAPKTVNVAWGNTTLTYNGNAQAPTATAATGIAGEELVVSVDGAQTNKGTYTATASITDTNYELSENTKTTQFTIAALQVFVTIGDIEDQTYNTQQIKPDVTISFKDEDENPVTLTENTDYTVTYGDNVNVAAGGSVTVTSVATSNYTFATANKTFVIKASDNVTLANENVNTQNVVVGVGTFADPVFIGIGGEAVNGTLTYSYNELTDKAKIQEALAALTKGDTAQVAYTFVASGNYAKTINGTINVTMVDIIFTVNGVAADASNAVTIKADPTYGDTWAQIVTIGNIVASVDGTEVPGTFTLSVSGTPDAGTQTYNVKFTSDNGKYTNVNVFTTDASVEIAKKSVAVEWTNTTKTYNGETQRPSASAVGVNSEQIVLNISCDVATVNAGTYTFTASTENNNYALTNTSTEFTIETKDIADAAIALGEALTYTGIEQTQTIESVTVDGLTVTYTVEGDKATDAGSYTLTVKGNGNFSGEATKGYTVAQKAITPDIVVEGTYKFTGSALTIVYTVKDGETVLAASDYTGSVTDNLNAGKATITVTANADGNYSFETATKKVDIAKADAKALADIERSQKYTVTDGTVSVGNGGMPANAGTLTYAADSESVVGTTVVADWSVDANGNVTYELSNPVAGDVVTLPVVISSQNYEDSTVKVVITIIEKDVPDVSANDITVTYNGSAVPESKITGTATFEGVTVTGSWSFKDAAPVNVADSGTVKVVFTPDDTTNYAVVETEITVTINKATPTGAPSYTMLEGIGRTLAEAGLSIGTIQPTGGTLTWDLGENTIAMEGVAYSWTYTLNDPNYNNLTGSAVLCRNTPPAPVIRPTKPAEPSEPTLPDEPSEPELPPVEVELPFVDVNADTPCYESIAYVYANGLMTLDGGLLSAEATASRAQIAYALHNFMINMIG